MSSQGHQPQVTSKGGHNYRHPIIECFLEYFSHPIPMVALVIGIVWGISCVWDVHQWFKARKRREEQVIIEKLERLKLFDEAERIRRHGL